MKICRNYRRPISGLILKHGAHSISTCKISIDGHRVKVCVVVRHSIQFTSNVIISSAISDNTFIASTVGPSD